MANFKATAVSPRLLHRLWAPQNDVKQVDIPSEVEGTRSSLGKYPSFWKTRFLFAALIEMTLIEVGIPSEVEGTRSSLGEYPSFWETRFLFAMLIEMTLIEVVMPSEAEVISGKLRFP
jgi:hypothetical protein